MSKIAVISDTHFGARNDSPIFLEHFIRFWDEVFFPSLKERGVNHIVHMGDFMDRRKFVNFHTLNATRKFFVDRLKKDGITMDLIIGNHDAYYRNTISLNSPTELFGTDSNIKVHDKPSVVSLDGLLVGFVPWIAKNNHQECMDFIADRKTDILFGHFEVNGCEAVCGVQHQEGMSPSTLEKYDAVYSGHFHFRHSRGNIHYLGTQYQMTFSDLGQTKGFHYFDTEDRSMEFVPNPKHMFTMLEYDDTARDYNMFSTADYKETFVRLMVKAKSKPFVYENLIDRLNATPVHGLTIIELNDKQEQSDPTVVDMSKDTLTLICDEIDRMENVDDPTRLKTLVREIYAESMQG
jgi:DNA repair exonuclease SbcCD nuclease subunit